MKRKVQDDLTVIKGIGPARQKWLGELFDVHTFGALGGLKIEEAEKISKKAGKILAKGEIADWVAKAKALAAEKGSRSDLDNVAKTAVPNAKSFWKPIASFVVEFQEKDEADRQQRRTKVHYMEADIETTWPGIEHEQIGLWIEQHVQVSELTPAPVEEIESILEKVDTFKPMQVRICQRPDYSSMLDMGQPERPFLGHVHHEEPITLEVDFELDPPVAGQPRADYNAQCEVHNLTTGQKVYYLEMVSDFSTNCLTYKTKLAEMEPGIYGLAVLMRGKRPLNTTYFELPKLNIL
ncbi:MAG: hypothetical protein GY805_38675 [Chloroflexi bacterium]|nr:hypothetical protein [Chloroflexota bacterium]